MLINNVDNFKYTVDGESFLLFEKYHLHRPGEFRGMDSGEVHTSRETGGIPNDRMMTGSHDRVDKRIDFLTCNVKYIYGDPAPVGKNKSNRLSSRRIQDSPQEQ